jgi:hypothetical protein
MGGYLGLIGHMIAALTEPKYLEIVLFDNEAIKIDKNLFMRNPAAVFSPGPDPSKPDYYGSINKFVAKSAEKQKKPFKALGGNTSYDSPLGVLKDLNITKGDRLIFIGDLEHNHRYYDKEIDALIKSGQCKDDFECISAWISHLCKRADSCIVINPKDIGVGGNDMTCDMLKYGVPTCFTGATGSKNMLTAESLRNTIECLKNGMTGQKPRSSEKVIKYCDGSTRAVNSKHRSGSGVSPF